MKEMHAAIKERNDSDYKQNKFYTDSGNFYETKECMSFMPHIQQCSM